MSLEADSEDSVAAHAVVQANEKRNSVVRFAILLRACVKPANFGIQIESIRERPVDSECRAGIRIAVRVSEELRRSVHEERERFYYVVAPAEGYNVVVVVALVRDVELAAHGEEHSFHRREVERHSERIFDR